MYMQYSKNAPNARGAAAISVWPGVEVGSPKGVLCVPWGGGHSRHRQRASSNHAYLVGGKVPVK